MTVLKKSTKHISIQLAWGFEEASYMDFSSGLVMTVPRRNTKK